MGIVAVSIVLSLYPLLFMASPQMPEINDQYEASLKPDITDINKTKHSYISEELELSKNQNQKDKKPEQKIFKNPQQKPLNEVNPTVKITYQLLSVLTAPIGKLIKEPKVIMVLKNIGTCIVNGVMEIISYYFPAPLMPLIATAAGILIPFEPVVTLRRRMPVTSYRRAIKTAVNSFLNTFDTYKVDDADDPYMTRRFNRRFLKDVSEETRKQ